MALVDWYFTYDDEDPSYLTVVLNDDDHILTTITSSGDEASSWISEVLRVHRRRLHHLCVGLDVEWRPAFGRYENPVAVLQLCVGRRCLIFQLLHADYVPEALADFLANPNFRFFGVGIDEDVEKLVCDHDIMVSNTVDLRSLAAEVTGRKEMKQTGLKKLAAAFMGIDVEKPKRVQLSKWDAEWLTNDQIMYACIDAFLSFEIGRRLC